MGAEVGGTGGGPAATTDVDAAARGVGVGEGDRATTEAGDEEGVWEGVWGGVGAGVAVSITAVWLVAVGSGVSLETAGALRVELPATPTDN